MRPSFFNFRSFPEAERILSIVYIYFFRAAFSPIQL
jgi:hypothetical protein